MDWYSWLTKTNLDPYLVHEYGRAFTHNELQRGDTNYFTHEFLQSMGVSVAKHRLEILKLARKNIGTCPKTGFSKIMSAITNTRFMLSKKLGKCVSFKHSVYTPTPMPDPNLFRPQWPGINLRKNMGFDENVEEKVKTKIKGVSSVSGPLDRKVQEKLMVHSSPMDTRPRPNHSGPLDVDYGPRLGIPYSMVHTAGCRDDEMSSVWSLMFQNIKPT